MEHYVSRVNIFNIVQYMYPLFLAAHLHIVFAMLHENRILVYPWCLGVQLNKVSLVSSGCQEKYLKKYHKILIGLNTTFIFSLSWRLEVGDSGEGCLCTLPAAVFPCVLTCQTERNLWHLFFCFFFFFYFKGTNLNMRASPLWSHLNLNYLPKAPSPNAIILEIRASICKCRGGENKIHFTAVCYIYDWLNGGADSQNVQPHFLYKPLFYFNAERKS